MIYIVKVFRICSIIIGIESVIYDVFVLKDSHNEKYLGGELAMWMDHFCENYQCWNEETPIHFPKAYWMFQQEYDQEFIKAILGMVPMSLTMCESYNIILLLYTATFM